MDLPSDRHLTGRDEVAGATTEKRGTGSVDGPAFGLGFDVMDKIPYPLATLSTDCEVRFVNTSMVELLGYPDARTLLETPVEKVAAQPEDIMRFRKLMERDGVVSGFEIELIRYNGKSIWLIGTVDEVDSADGPYWQAALTDITDHKLAERAAAESRDRYRTVFEQSPVGLWEEDFSALDGWFEGLRAAGVKDLQEHLRRHPEDAKQASNLVRMVDVNPSGVTLAGAESKSQVLGSVKHLETYIPCLVEEMLAIWEGRTEFQTEIAVRTLDGRDAALDLHMAVPTIDGQLDLSRVMVAIHDVTDRVKAEQARHEAEKLFREAFDAAPIGMVLTSPTGQILEVSPAFCSLAGRSASDLAGSNWRDLMHPEDVAMIEPELAAFRAGHTQFIDAEMRFVRPDKTVAWTSVRATTVRDSRGSPSYVIGQFVDITELHRSHTALTRLFETIPAALYRTTPEGQILDANPALLDILGYPDLTSAQAPDLTTIYVDPTQRDRFKASIEERDVVMGFEYELYHASGKTIWVHDSARRVRDDVTQQVRFEGALVDITEQKRAHLELQASERRYRNVFNRSPIALFEEDFSEVHAWIEELKTTGVTDIRAHLEEHPDAILEAIGHVEILDANPAAARLLEADSTDQLLGPIQPSMASRAQESFVEQVVALAEGRDRLFLEATGQTFTGRDIDIVVVWVLSPGEDQVNSHRVLVAVVDVTERRKALRQLEELVRTKDQIIASVSHGIRTPLTTVVGFAQEMRDNWDDMPSNDVRDYVDLIANQAVEVSNIVEDLMVSARLDFDRLTVNAASVDLFHQTHQVIAHLDSQDQRSIAVKGDRAMAWADQVRTRQILRNLVANALSHGGPNIEIHTASNEVHATVTVRDDGVGIAPADLERAFQRYERLHEAPTQPPSIGLGLHLSRALARLMDGDVTYAHGEGWTEFTLTLPSGPSAGTPDHANNRHIE